MEFKDNEVNNWINGMSKEPNKNNKPRIVDDAGVDIETGKSAMPSMTVDRAQPKITEDEMSLNQELMIILMEECGELIQACSKAIRCNSYYRNEKLVEEVGDVMCMLELLEENNIINWTEVDERVFKKKKKLMRWSNIYNK